MKCKSCGAELYGRRCEYCGTATDSPWPLAPDLSVTLNQLASRPITLAASCYAPILEVTTLTSSYREYVESQEIAEKYKHLAMLDWKGG